MIFKITFDEADNPVQADVWMELDKIPAFEPSTNPNGFRVDKYGWVNAENKEEAIEKAKNLS